MRKTSGVVENLGFNIEPNAIAYDSQDARFSINMGENSDLAVVYVRHNDIHPNWTHLWFRWFENLGIIVRLVNLFLKFGLCRFIGWMSKCWAIDSTLDNFSSN